MYLIKRDAEGSLPYSQQLATGSCPEPDEARSYLLKQTCSAFRMVQPFSAKFGLHAGNVEFSTLLEEIMGRRTAVCGGVGERSRDRFPMGSLEIFR